MSRTVSTLLLDLAAWIAPPHRRQWIAGLRAEAAQAGHSTGWAWGALTTALGQRLADTVASGLALRVCPAGTVLAETMALAGRIAAFPPHATREIKRLMLEARRPDVVAARAREESAFAALFADPDTNPGSQLTAGLER